jgi:hypothetical protein
VPIVDLQRRLHEAGRIRIGVQVPTSRGKKRPQKLTTFRITGQDHRALERVAALYGGTLEAWKDAPVGEQWQVITETAEIRVAVPPERMALSQSMELWSGGGCVRRCDGERQTNDDPCVCAALDGEDPQPRCSRHTRLSLMLAELATTGLWRLDTQGFYASEELAGALELAQILAGATGRSLLPGWLRLEQREIRRPGEPTKQFAVPVLDLEMDTAALLGPSRIAPALTLPAAATNGEPPVLTPIPAEARSTLAEELAQVDDPAPPRPRRNAAAAVPATGLKPRTAAQARATKTDQPEAEQPPAPPPRATEHQRRKLFAGLREHGINDRDDMLDWINARLERTIVSSKELTKTEVSKLIDAVANEPAKPELTADEVMLDEAKTDDSWLRQTLADLGVEIPADEMLTIETLRRLTPQQVTRLRTAFNADVDTRQADPKGST